MHSAAVYTTETETQKYDIYKFFRIYIIMTRQKYFDSIYFSSAKAFFNLNSYCRDCLQNLLTWTARARLTNERLCALFSGWLSALWRGLHGCIRLAAFLWRNLSWLTQNTNFVKVLGTVQHGYEWNEKMQIQTKTPFLSWTIRRWWSLLAVGINEISIDIFLSAWTQSVKELPDHMISIVC